MYLLAYIPVLEQLSAPEREREREEKGGRERGGDGGGERGSRGRERPFEAKAQYRLDSPLQHPHQHLLFIFFLFLHNRCPLPPGSDGTPPAEATPSAPT